MLYYGFADILLFFFTFPSSSSSEIDNEVQLVQLKLAFWAYIELSLIFFNNNDGGDDADDDDEYYYFHFYFLWLLLPTAICIFDLVLSPCFPSSILSLVRSAKLGI